jgi:hypothetical protein
MWLKIPDIKKRAVQKCLQWWCSCNISAAVAQRLTLLLFLVVSGTLPKAAERKYAYIVSGHID